MGISKLILLSVMAMAFVVSVRCQYNDDSIMDEMESATELEKINNHDHVNKPTTPPSTTDRKGVITCLKERVRKIIEKGREMIKAAREAISKSYSEFKAKTKEIIGKKELDSVAPSKPSDSESYPASIVPSEHYHETSSELPDGPQNSHNESDKEVDLDPILRQKLNDY